MAGGEVDYGRHASAASSLACLKSPEWGGGNLPGFAAGRRNEASAETQDRKLERLAVKEQVLNEECQSQPSLAGKRSTVITRQRMFDPLPQSGGRGAVLRLGAAAVNVKGHLSASS
jgi:hypothetical protein